MLQIHLQRAPVDPSIAPITPSPEGHFSQDPFSYQRGADPRGM